MIGTSTVTTKQETKIYLYHTYTRYSTGYIIQTKLPSGKAVNIFAGNDDNSNEEPSWRLLQPHEVLVVYDLLLISPELIDNSINSDVNLRCVKVHFGR